MRRHLRPALTHSLVPPMTALIFTSPARLRARGILIHCTKHPDATCDGAARTLSRSGLERDRRLSEQWRTIRAEGQTHE